jgi:sigma-B regulation protein RsbU (phosphoserine phosphatase)
MHAGAMVRRNDGALDVKQRSITAKLLVALLLVSLLPLLIFFGIGYAERRWALMHTEDELTKSAMRNLTKMASDHAKIADATLGQVEREVSLVKFASEQLLLDPLASPLTRQDHLAGSRRASFNLAPTLKMDQAKVELDRYDHLNSLFGQFKDGDPNLLKVYLGTTSGLQVIYPAEEKSKTQLLFTLSSELSAGFDETTGVLSAPLQARFGEFGVEFKSPPTVTTLFPGERWLIKGGAEDRLFTLRRTDGRLEAYKDYDPRTRRWYGEAVRQDRTVWSKYPNWDFGELLFSLPRDTHEMRRMLDALEQIGRSSDNKITIKMSDIFKVRQILLAEGSSINLSKVGHWRLFDKNKKSLEIRQEDGGLNVYGLDILTCARPFRDSQGRLAGVAAIDIRMSAISKIINTSREISGNTFLLNYDGDLIEQEVADMFIPAVDSDIRKIMTSGKAGIEWDRARAAYVAYAPIRSISAMDGKLFWSLGISISEAEITRLADEIRHRARLMLALLAVILLVVGAAVVWAAIHISRGITGPILELNEGAIRIGRGDLTHRLSVKSGDEVEQLSDTFNKMAEDLGDYVRSLKETTAVKERFESELRVGRDIQMSFLKKIFPAFPDRREFSLFAAIEPAREVGGDLYDFSLLDDNRLLFYVGDVSDKGVPASLIMAMTMTLMKQAAYLKGNSPADILAQVNLALATDNQSAMFVTLFLGILDIGTGELVFSNAGHNPPLILSAGGEARYLELPDGLVLGVMTEAEYTDSRIVLAEGDMIVAYTDGVTEAMSPQRALYSDERLQQVVGELAGLDPQEMITSIIASVHAHADTAPQSDDITLLAVRRKFPS